MSCSSREDSPDWLRSFQAPTLSSGSISPVKQCDDDEDEVTLTRLFPKKNSPIKDDQITPGRKRKRKGENEKEDIEVCNEIAGNQRDVRHAKEEITSEKPSSSSANNHSVWALTSDSDDSLHEIKPVASANIVCDAEESLRDELSDEKAPKKRVKKESDKQAKAKEVKVQKDGENAGDIDLEEKTAEKCGGLYVSSSRLPLVLSEKVQRTKALVECEGDSMDLSGDVGAVGRVVISEDFSGKHEMLLDLKGTVYRTKILPSRTFCVVSLGQSEAKIEAVMNDFIQLMPKTNVFEAETLVEGTLDGFSFDLEEEMDNMSQPNAGGNQGEGEDEKEPQEPKGKTKAKAGKPKALNAASQKKTKGTGAKRAKKKSLAPKTNKSKSKK
ncbi:OLC1v1020972C1 [Oldenlandia corymbosa var. corymbosa]|uniref:OLC1v1020972C1 n=1 Tax=Oldenlandia corymbosa var. corymbosa TaxID=529605 RepID=A0AAV1BUN8_OLDCO|nr:OLC1v1020972C1 [Oldenlandia corymbosa var. corymbosa]